MNELERKPPPIAEGPEREGGLRQVVRDRSNLSDSPLGEFVRVLRGLVREGQERRK